MGKPKFDGVVEAARYKSAGLLEWVRVYERRGPTWSDRVILNRKELVERLKAGKVFMAGHRMELLGGTFKVSSMLHLVKNGDREVIVTNGQGEQDALHDVPLI